MMLAKFLKQVCSFCLVIAAARSACASEHAVTIIAASPIALKELAGHVPTTVQQQLKDMTNSIVGPLASAATPEAAIGVWLDWRGDIPTPVIFIQRPDIQALRQTLEVGGVATKELGLGITEITFGPRLFVREVENWLFIATTADELRSLSVPSNLASLVSNHSLAIEINLKRIPQDTLNELSEVLSTRLLPPEVTLADENSANGLVKLYVNRLFKDITSHADQILLSVDSRDHAIAMSAHVTGAGVQPKLQQIATFSFPGSKLCRNVASVQLDLRAEEQAMLTWWAQSLPGQIEASINDAQIENRGGEQSIVKATQSLAELIGRVSQRGRLEAFAGMIGNEQDAPFIGVHSPENLSNFVQQMLASEAARELGIGTVGNIDEVVPGVSLQQFSVDQDGVPVLCNIATSNDAVYFTIGQTGVRTLTQFLQEPKPTTPAMPLGLRLEKVKLPTLFGWVDDTNQPTADLEITSRYTSEGMHFDLLIGEVAK